MMVSVEQAQTSLKELIEKSSRGEKVVVTQDQQPVAELVSLSPAKPLPVFGSCRGKPTKAVSIAVETVSAVQAAQSSGVGCAA